MFNTALTSFWVATTPDWPYFVLSTLVSFRPVMLPPSSDVVIDTVLPLSPILTELNSGLSLNANEIILLSPSFAILVFIFFPRYLIPLSDISSVALAIFILLPNFCVCSPPWSALNLSPLFSNPLFILSTYSLTALLLAKLFPFSRLSSPSFVTHLVTSILLASFKAYSFNLLYTCPPFTASFESAVILPSATLRTVVGLSVVPSGFTNVANTSLSFLAVALFWTSPFSLTLVAS